MTIFRNDFDVVLVDSMGDDHRVCQAARVSTQGAESYTSEESAGLINFLMSNRHGSPFEHGLMTWMVSAPIFVWREFMRHRIASYNEECLAGDTVVTRIAPNGSTFTKNSRLDLLYRNWHEGVPDSLGRVRLLPSCKNIYVRSFNESSLKPVVSKVLDIVKTTGKTTWLVTTETGKQIRTSMSHKYFTPDKGWVRLEELKVGDWLYRNGLVRVEGTPVIPPRLRQGIQIWTTQLKPHLISTHGAACYVCGEHFTYAELQLDHEIPVVLDLKLALDEGNIKPACVKCHRLKTNLEQQHASRGVNGSVRADKIISISDPVQEDTYDLVLEGSHHNFLANGVMVHNSGRYKQLEPTFYVPSRERPLIQVGKAGAYDYVPGSDEQYEYMETFFQESATTEYARYAFLLNKMDIAKEVARMYLPLAIYSTAYVTMNIRGLMNFLSLRTKSDDSTYKSFPQYEISQVANQMELHFQEKFPLVHTAFVKAGRVQP